MVHNSKSGSSKMIDLSIITGPGDGETGIGDYTDSLVSNMNMVDKEVFRLPKSDLQGYYYLIIAVQTVREDRDVIHVQHEYGLFGPFSLISLVFFPLLYIGAKIKKKPVVITVHESLNNRLTAQPLPRLKGFYIFLLNKCLVSCSDHLIFLSENAQEEFAESVTIPSSTVIPHGVDLNNTVNYNRSTARQLLDIDVKDHAIMEPGYISRRKGCHLMVELAKQLPEYNFILAGGPEDDSQRD